MPQQPQTGLGQQQGFIAVQGNPGRYPAPLLMQAQQQQAGGPYQEMFSSPQGMLNLHSPNMLGYNSAPMPDNRGGVGMGQMMGHQQVYIGASQGAPGMHLQHMPVGGNPHQQWIARGGESFQPSIQPVQVQLGQAQSQMHQQLASAQFGNVIQGIPLYQTAFRQTPVANQGSNGMQQGYNQAMQSQMVHPQAQIYTGKVENTREQSGGQLVGSYLTSGMQDTGNSSYLQNANHMPHGQQQYNANSAYSYSSPSLSSGTNVQTQSNSVQSPMLQSPNVANNLGQTAGRLSMPSPGVSVQSPASCSSLSTACFSPQQQALPGISSFKLMDVSLPGVSPALPMPACPEALRSTAISASSTTQIACSSVTSTPVATTACTTVSTATVKTKTKSVRRNPPSVPATKNSSVAVGKDKSVTSTKVPQSSIIVPYGWKRDVIRGRVVYYS